MSVALFDAVEAVNWQAQFHPNLRYVVERTGNASQVARSLGIRRGELYYLLGGGFPRLPALVSAINQWAERLRREPPPAS